MESQLMQYETVLSDYGKEMNVGQVSVLDYITVLRNRQLVIAAYNYWNW